MKTYTVTGGGGLKLHVDETGNPKGRPLLFIHGFSQCRLSWNKQMHSDLEKDFRLIATDIRGHGFVGFNLAVPPHVRAGLMNRQVNNEDLLSTLRKPVLITHGERDDIVGVSLARHHAEKIEHAQTSYYPTIGHAPFWEDAERFNRELRAFAVAL